MPEQIDDRARRVSDTVSQHLVDTDGAAAGRWIAVRLSDGRGGDTLYDRKRDAVRHVPDEQHYAFICVTPDGMNPRQAATFLRFTEGLYAAGARLADPDAHVPVPDRPEQIPGLIRAVARGR